MSTDRRKERTRYLVSQIQKDEALQLACIKGDLEMVRYTVSEDTDQRIKNHALVLAVDEKHTRIIEYLVSQGADIHTKNEHVLLVAAVNGWLGIVQSVVLSEVSPYRRKWALWNACANGNLDIVQYLVSMGMDIHDGVAVKEAAASDSLEVLQYLLSLGADINTALQGAVRNGALDTSRYLVSLGADVHVCDEDLIEDLYENDYCDVADYILELQSGTSHSQ